MDNYLIDRETLGKFVDELIKKKALPVNSPEELEEIREDAISRLDRKIGIAIFCSLTKDQYAQFEELSDDENSTYETFEAFFKDSGVDFEKVIIDAAKEFGEEFLATAGGQNG